MVRCGACLLCITLMAIQPAVAEERAPPGKLRTEDLRDFDKLPPARQRLIRLALDTGRAFELNQYHFGSADPTRGGFDCSGAMYYLLEKIGLEPARSSAAQYEWLKRAGTLKPVPADTGSLGDAAFADLQPGDLLFWSGTYRAAEARPNKITHVQMYLGREKSDGRPVMIGSTDGRSYRGARRRGYGVYDFKLPRAGSSARFAGYGPAPGLLRGE